MKVKIRELTLLLGLAAGCGESSVLDTGQLAPVTSLRDDVMPIISQSCGGCHTRTNPPFEEAVAGGAYYDREEDLLGLVGTYILPGDAQSSAFVAILTQELSVGQGPTPMPPPDLAEPMSEEDVSVVMAWIDEGALNN